jgi:hypothetical protein
MCPHLRAARDRTGWANSNRLKATAVTIALSTAIPLALFVAA